MAFIIWLSLRNANLARYIPVPVQNYLQDLNERLGLSRRIRLPASYTSFGQNSQDRGEAITNLSIHNGDSSDDEDDHDDELPLAHRWQNGSARRFRQGGSQLNRLISLFTGKGQASSYGLLNGNANHTSNGYRLDDEEEEADGTVLQLPNLPASNNPARQAQQTRKKPKSSPSLFTLDTADLDAPAIGSNFTLSPSRLFQANPFASFNGSLGSPDLARANAGYGFPRSPIRSPSLSRTPSLGAIAEETSVSPRGSHETARKSANMSRNASTDSGTSSGYDAQSRAETSLPDWASAVSTQRPRSDSQA